MTVASQSPHFSAQVQMDLRLDGKSIPVAQLGPNFLILKDLMDLPVSEGEIALRIDEHVTQFPVRLELGASKSIIKTPITPIAPSVTVFRSHGDASIPAA
jgi:hypothetical protein